MNYQRVQDCSNSIDLFGSDLLFLCLKKNIADDKDFSLWNDVEESFQFHCSTGNLRKCQPTSKSGLTNRNVKSKSLSEILLLLFVFFLVFFLRLIFIFLKVQNMYIDSRLSEEFANQANLIDGMSHVRILVINI